ncbi:unnamed protein product [Acanthosepion pharaonis]|uniref:Reverse transcriptase domain-containing protein n=1 Tax=Acanthosepion pharaonis TaxID=158019 RepID=A0A812DJV3_ACAPH|nr:unnamed protein product [Sepia pharaonis]
MKKAKVARLTGAANFRDLQRRATHSIRADRNAPSPKRLSVRQPVATLANSTSWVASARAEAVLIRSSACGAYQQPTVLCFVDFAAAFDSVDRDSLWRIMEADGMPAKLFRLIKVYYRSTRARVRAYDTLLSFPLYLHLVSLFVTIEIAVSFSSILFVCRLRIFLKQKANEQEVSTFFIHRTVGYTDMN